MMSERMKKFIRNRMFVQIMTYLVLFAVALFIVYWLRVFYYFDYASAPVMILISTAVVFISYTVIRIVSAHTEKKFAFWGAITVLFCGTLFAFANPPIQTPDESAHFLRTYAIASGHFDFDPERQYPNDVGLLLEEFEPFYSHYHQGQGDQIIYRYENYYDRLEQGEIADTDKDNEPILMLILPYIPAAIVIAPLIALGVDALILSFVIKLVNVIVFSAICYYALTVTERFRVLFLSFMLLPTTMFIAASSSYDSAMLAFSILIIAFAFKSKITTSDNIIISIVTAYACHIKILNLLLIIPVLSVAKERWVSKIPKWIFVAIAGLFTAIGSVAVTTYAGIFSYFEPIPRLDSVDPVGQIFFILSNIPRYIMVLFGTFYENTFFLFGMSNFGWTDTPVPIIGYIILPLMIVVALLTNQYKKGDMILATTLFAFGVVYVLSAITGIYLTNTPVAMVRVIGVQARYFLPSIYAFFLSLSMFSGRYLDIKCRFNTKDAVAILGGFSVISAVLLFLTHNVIW